MTTNEEQDKRPESFRCSGLVRRAAAIQATSHHDRIWPVNEAPYSKVSTMMGINLAQVGPKKEILAASLLHGIGDEATPYPDHFHQCFCRSNVCRIQRLASWTDFAGQVKVAAISDWSDVLVRWRGHLSSTSPAALLVICAYEHYLLTTLDDMCQQINDATVWQRWYMGFPEPYNQFGQTRNPFLTILEHYRGRRRTKPGSADGWIGVNAILQQRLNIGRGLINEMVTIIRGLDTTFRTAGLI